MSTNCKAPIHRFLLEANPPILAPDLDLVPGRRCLCGCYVIIDHPGVGLPTDRHIIVKIDSPTAAHFAKVNPTLKTW